MMNYGEYVGLDFPADAPFAVRDRLVLQATEPIPNNPNTAAQGSARMIPAGWGYYAAASAKFGAFGSAHLKRIKEWLAQEARWRGLPNGTPEMYATKPGWFFGLNDALMLNDAGQPLAVRVYDDQHFTVRQYLDAWHLTGNDVPLKMAGALIGMVRKDYPPAKVATMQNPRAIAHLLIGLADWYAATGDSNTLPLADSLVHRCATFPTPADAVAGVPFVTVNQPSAIQVDHGCCRCCTWMTARIGWALILWRRLMPLTPQAQLVLDRVIACLKYLRGKADPFEFMAVDWDPNGMLHHEPKNAMLRWCLPVMMESGDAELRAAAESYWLSADWSRPTDKNFGGQHALSLNLYMASKLGWH